MKKILLITAVVLSVLLILMWLLPSVLISTEKIENVSSEALGEGYRVDVSNSSVNLFRRSVTLQDIVVLSEPADTLFTARNLRVGGVGLFAAINGEADINSFILSDFKVYENAFTASFDQDSEESELSSVRVGGISLENGEVVYRLENGDLFQANGLYFSAVLPEYNPEEPDREVTGIFSEMTFIADRLHLSMQEGLSFLEVENVSFDESMASLSVDRVEIGSHLSDQEYFAELEYRQDFTELEIENMTLSGIDIERLKKGEGMYAAEMETERFDLHITASLKLEKDPGSVGRTMPLEAFHKMPLDVSIQRIFFQDGDIRYSEYAADGVRPGTIHFAEIEAEVMDVQNLSAEPMLLNARTMLEGNGEILTSISLAWRESGSHIELTGGMGLFEIAKLNSIFEDLEGISIKEGTMDNLSYAFIMTDLRADGTMDAKYQNLSIEVIDKGDHEQDLIQYLGGLLADEVIIRANSGDSGDDVRVGTIDNEYNPEHSFFKYLWESLRSGIFDMVMRV